MLVKCGACGETSEVASCPSCGAELPIGTAGIETASDRDQTQADRDQTASDQDQTWSDHDQTASDRDQRSSNEDQAASDADFAAGGDVAAHDQNTRTRTRTSHDRAAVSQVRTESAVERLSTAANRDHAAALRDRGAASRDALARLQDEQDDTNASREDILLRAERDRARAAADRVQAAADRTRAAVEREQAAAERADALSILATAEEAVELARTDELTGARTRAFGLEEMVRELERAHRTGGTLILAFVDVNGLKEVNDREGHLAGDALLRLTGETLRANVRSYDVLVRYGGDEFVCAMPNVTTTIARPRFKAIAAFLAAIDAEHSITYGLAEAGPSENLQELIARADTDLLETRRTKKDEVQAAPPNGDR